MQLLNCRRTWRLIMNTVHGHSHSIIRNSSSSRVSLQFCIARKTLKALFVDDFSFNSLTLGQFLWWKSWIHWLCIIEKVIVSPHACDNTLTNTICKSWLRPKKSKNLITCILKCLPSETNVPSIARQDYQDYQFSQASLKAYVSVSLFWYPTALASPNKSNIPSY